MDQICLTVPVLAGQTDRAITFMKELESSRRSEYEASEQRLGITKEVWFLAREPDGDRFVSYMESPDFAGAFERFVASRDEFDLWFKAELANATGVDLNHPPEMELPELLSSYEA